jgi:DNA invertase Pin-like site-specific DNA recombinase
MDNGKIKDKHLSRIVYVYIRQSTSYQVEHNLESLNRQYQLVEKAKGMGFRDVRVIDEDQGKSAGGYANRSGFKKLVAEVGLNRVGIIFGLEVSRISRNNRDLYHLLDLCALFDTLIADQDGVYNPGHPNDRMLLGLKGAMSEVEINILKSRMLEGARNKAKRGELIYCLPIGLVKTEDDKIEKDPNKRIQKAIEQVFFKFREFRSVRQTFLWFVREEIPFPSAVYGRFGREVVWKVPGYSAIRYVLKNPAYAGAYAYGMRETRKYLDDSEIKATRNNLEMKDWKVLIKNNHSGYISWEEYELNREAIQDNSKMMGAMIRGPILKGNGLLTGLLRCKRCGRKLSVSYGGKSGKIPRYSCDANRLMKEGGKGCLKFGGLGLDEAVAQEVLRAVEPFGIESSLKAVEEFNKETEKNKEIFLLELENAEYEAERAFRQYDKVEPENRLVRPQLESKWNHCLEKVEKAKDKLSICESSQRPLSDKEKEEIMCLSEDLPELWNSPTTTNELRKELIRTVIKEIMVDINQEGSLALSDIHWMGGLHTNLEIKRRKKGGNGQATNESTIELVRQLADQFPDKDIAPLLNKLNLKTGRGKNWTEGNVRALRNYHKISVYNVTAPAKPLTISDAAKKLGISNQSVKSLIKKRFISAKQILPNAPWAIPAKELDKEEVENAVKLIKNGANLRKIPPLRNNQMQLFQ